MRNRVFCSVDYYGQMMILVSSLVLLIFDVRYAVLIYLFGLGPWQFISSIVVRAEGAVVGWPRRVYELVTWSLMLLALLSTLYEEVILKVLTFAFFYGLVAGVYYFLLTLKEFSKLKELKENSN